jgi:putative membrane protein
VRSISMARSVAALAACCMAAGGGLALGHVRSDRPAPTPSGADRGFMRAAARWDFAEIEAGLLARRRGAAASVKVFGARVVADRARANDRLIALAQRLNVALPTEPSDAARKGLARLARLSGDAFDASFVRIVVEDDEQDIRTFAREAKHGRNPQVVDYAQSTQPVLTDELLLARQLP